MQRFKKLVSWNISVEDDFLCNYMGLKMCFLMFYDVDLIAGCCNIDVLCVTLLSSCQKGNWGLFCIISPKQLYGKKDFRTWWNWIFIMNHCMMKWCDLVDLQMSELWVLGSSEFCCNCMQVLWVYYVSLGHAGPERGYWCLIRLDDVLFWAT